MADTNDQLVLICGISGTGKSTSLKDIKNQDKWLYLGTEAGKRLPFQNNFDAYRIVDPYQVLEGFDYGIGNPEIEGIIIDSMTFLMDMFESTYVIDSSNGMKAWSQYQQFFKEIMQKKVIEFERPVIITAHTKDDINEKTAEVTTAVPIKGALRGNGIESYFSSVLGTKKMSLKELEKYDNDLLTITEDDEILGYKYVFQTRLTKKTIGERIRTPIGLFSINETFIDNNTQLLLDRLTEFYK